MKTARTLLLLASIILAPSANAQEGRITFADTTHSFGTFQESEEAVHVFTFRNEGDAPLHLTNVVPSCGCTTPEWTKEAVEPGGSGDITVAYDSEGHPGLFERTVAVYTDGDPELVTLTIAGDVLPKPLENAVAQGNLLIEGGEGDLGSVTKGEHVLHTIRVQNSGTEPLRIEAVDEPAENLFILFPSRPLDPGSIARIQIIVDTEALAPGSSFEYPLSIETDDPEQPIKTARVTGRIR